MPKPNAKLIKMLRCLVETAEQLTSNESAYFDYYDRNGTPQHSDSVSFSECHQLIKDLKNGKVVLTLKGTN